MSMNPIAAKNTATGVVQAIHENRVVESCMVLIAIKCAYAVHYTLPIAKPFAM
jgi:hypothetical protein